MFEWIINKNKFIYIRIEKKKKMIKAYHFNMTSNSRWLFDAYVITSKSNVNLKKDIINKLFSDEKNLKILRTYSAEVSNIKDDIKNDTIEFFQLSLYNYYLKPYLSMKNNGVILPVLPHKIIESYYYGTYYRLMHNNPNSKLRSYFGKYVLEEYLYKIISESNYFDFVCKEFKYNNKQNRTADVIAVENNTLIFFEMKASVVPKDLRNIYNNEKLDEMIERESDKINQVYKQIQNYNNFKFNIGEINTVFDDVIGIIVNFEDSYIDRSKIFERFFEVHLPNASLNKKIEISKIIRLMDLSDLEIIMNFNYNTSFKGLIFGKDYTTFTYSSNISFKSKKTENISNYLGD